MHKWLVLYVVFKSTFATSNCSGWNLHQGICAWWSWAYKSQVRKLRQNEMFVPFYPLGGECFILLLLGMNGLAALKDICCIPFFFPSLTLNLVFVAVLVPFLGAEQKYCNLTLQMSKWIAFNCKRLLCNLPIPNLASKMAVVSVFILLLGTWSI